jgi:CRISPR/Cas system-associated protein endoribonuclease Cas2
VKHEEQQRINTSRKDAREMKMDKNLQDIKYKRIVKSRNSIVYMYSAIQNSVPNKTNTSSLEEATTAQMSVIVVNGWELNQNQSPNFICCHMMEDGSVIPISSSEKRNWLYLGMAKLQAKQYTCNTINNNSRTKFITIESPGSMCPTDTKYYMWWKPCFQTAKYTKEVEIKRLLFAQNLPMALWMLEDLSSGLRFIECLN